MRVRRVTSPLSRDAVSSLSVGDVVYLSGLVFTARDLAHKFVVEGLRGVPFNTEGLAVFHAGPTVRREGSKWVITSIGPTTSSRMTPYIRDFLRITRVKLVIGKGFLTGDDVTNAFKDHGAVYAIYPGGCGALGAMSIKEVISVYWLDLGVPEALWLLRVESLGPLIIAIDSNGDNLGSERLRSITKLRRSIINKLRNFIDFHVGLRK